MPHRSSTPFLIALAAALFAVAWGAFHAPRGQPEPSPQVEVQGLTPTPVPSAEARVLGADPEAPLDLRPGSVSTERGDPHHHLRGSRAPTP